MSRFDDFVERLEAALGDEEGRDAFLEYLQAMTPQERAELLAEAERRDPEGGGGVDPRGARHDCAGGRREARNETGFKPAGKKRDGKK